MGYYKHKEGGRVKIHEVERLVGITKKNIRFYEKEGLLTPDRNSENGYREYGGEDVAVLKQIKLLRKLGLPLEEIRQLQAGRCTVGDAMRRHLVTLERERRNLEQAVQLCSGLQDMQERLDSLDPDAVLQEMEQMEQGGTTFLNKQKEDVRIQYVGPVVAALVMILLMLGTMVLLVWAYVAKPEGAPPPAVMLVFLMVPVAVIVGVLMALLQRVREIGKGEIERAKQY